MLEMAMLLRCHGLKEEKNTMSDVSDVQQTHQSLCMFSHGSRASIHISNAQFVCILQVMRKKTLEELGCVAQLRREIEIQSHLK